VCFRQFMQTIAPKLSPEQWEDMLLSFSLCFEASLPTALESELEEFFGDDNKGGDDAKLDLSLSKCMVQLFLINTISNALGPCYEKWTMEDAVRILTCLESSYNFSKALNSRFEVSIKLQRADQQAGLQLFPGIVQHEHRSLATMLSIQFLMYFRPKEGQPEDNAASLFQLCSTVLKAYINMEAHLLSIKRDKLEIAEATQENEGEVRVDSRPAKDLKPLEIQEGILVRQIQSLTPIVQKQILANFQELPDADLNAHATSLGPILIDLSLCDDYEIRAQNKCLLSKLFQLLQGGATSQ